MKQIFNKLSLAIVVLSVLFSCNSSNTTSMQEEVIEKVVELLKTVVDKPFENVKLAAEVFKYNINEGFEVTLDNGSSIKVPSDAFVKKNGDQVSGEVRLEYTEYNDAAKILLSGIPMKWNNNGTTVDFQSAGMMEIRAYQNNEELKLAIGKTLDVSMASLSEEDNYDAFYFDEELGNWRKESYNLLKENIVKQQALDELDETESMTYMYEPKEYDEAQYTFDLNIDYKKFPELKTLNGVLWQYAGTEESTDPRKYPGFKEQKWEKVDLERLETDENNFKLTMINSKNNKFESIVTPVLRGKSLQAAKDRFKEKFEAFKRKQELRKAEKERIERQANYLRSFQVAQMGIYNYDRQLKYPDRIELAATFDFGDLSDNDINKVTVFLITEKGTAVVKYPPNDWNLFAFSPSADNKLLAVLPGDKVAVYTQEQFNKLGNLGMPRGEKVEFKFEMKPIDAEIKTSEQVSEIIASI